jgi:hypothetical protein
MRKHFGLIIGIVFVMATASVASAVEITNNSFTIDGGGGSMATGSFVLSGTIGQPDAGGPMTGGSFALSGGFWPGAVATPAVPGDCDGDGDVDLDDYTEMALCLLGPDSTLGSGCECLDFDLDNDIDLVDFAELQVEFTGS